VILKTGALYTIMITGALWERAVFGRYLFAPDFFWEDVLSMLVLALHDLMLLAIAAYATCVVNATQFLAKLRMARLEAWPGLANAGDMAGAAL
jgi:3-vinyl bacteriochlorophyllide hydratase